MSEPKRAYDAEAQAIASLQLEKLPQREPKQEVNAPIDPVI